jgi:hypothetical protein
MAAKEEEAAAAAAAAAAWVLSQASLKPSASNSTPK